MKKQLDLFIAFFRSTMLGYGGGPSTIPLVKKEVVDTYHWMDSDEFGDTLALANALPGPIATKMAGYIGYRIGGVVGMLNALMATIVPTIVMMVLLLTVLNTYKDEPWVHGMAMAVVPVVAVMLATMTWDFLKSSSRSPLKMVWTVTFVVVHLVLMEWLHVHPAIIIFALIIVAMFKKDRVKETSS